MTMAEELHKLWKREPKSFGRRYCWDEWFKQSVFTLYKGERADFNVQIHGMIQMIRTNAKKRGFVAACTSTDSSITVTLTPIAA